MTPTPLELCEDFVLHVPPRRDMEAVIAPGYAFIPRGPGGSLVQQIRLADAGEIHAAVERTRILAREAERAAVVWWVGELATPDDIVDLLAAEGLVPDEHEPRLASLVLDREPLGDPPPLEIVRAETLEDFVTAQNLDLADLGIAPDDGAEAAAQRQEHWDSVRRDGIIQTYLARAAGEPVAFARAAFGAQAVALLGATTLEAERGKGYYTALVHARWRDAVARGTPLLLTQAGKMSRPILTSLGFEEVGEIRLLVDHL